MVMLPLQKKKSQWASERTMESKYLDGNTILLSHAVNHFLIYCCAVIFVVFAISLT